MVNGVSTQLNSRSWEIIWETLISSTPGPANQRENIESKTHKEVEKNKTEVLLFGKKANIVIKLWFVSFSLFIFQRNVVDE